MYRRLEGALDGLFCGNGLLTTTDDSCDRAETEYKYSQRAGVGTTNNIDSALVLARLRLRLRSRISSQHTLSSNGRKHKLQRHYIFSHQSFHEIVTTRDCMLLDNVYRNHHILLTHKLLLLHNALTSGSTSRGRNL